MRDMNEPVRVAYAARLLQISNMGVYYQALPNNINPDNYIVFRSLTDNDVSTKSSSDVSLNITVEIHTKNNIANTGLNVDTIADQVYQLIYPNKQTNITLSRGQVLQTQMVVDRTLDYQLKNQFGYIDRFITFRHWIFCEGTGGGNTGLTTQGQVFRLEYSAIGGEAGFTDTNLINKKILEVSKDGISFSELIFSGSPIDKEVLYQSITGAVTFGILLEADEEVVVLYQVNNPYEVMRFEYTGIGGEFGFTTATLSNINVLRVSRDGVSASQILSAGVPVDKEVLYEITTGEIQFAIAIEPSEQIIILYQL
jgi:hypothetical protein